MISLIFLATVSYLILKVQSAYCNGKPSPNAQSNNFPYYPSNVEWLRSSDYGDLYIAGPEFGIDENQQLYVLHVYGDPYQLGYAHGYLLKEEVNYFFNAVWEYIMSEVPLHEVAPDLVNMTMEDALQLTADLTAPYTPDYWFEEMRGLSDASGVSYDQILRIHMLPELTKGACSMFGAWGKATPNGNLIQLRALDWDDQGPFKDYPALVIYHPTNGNDFANLGWTGWIGSITGVSNKRLSISEIGVSYPDDTFGKESRSGYPFNFVLRDILQFDNSVDNATYRLNNTHRTCDLILGAGSGEQSKFRAYEYSYSVLNVEDDTNMQPYNETWHPRIENIVYYGMDWLCPNYDEVLSQQLLTYYGNITSENAMKNIVAKTQTGNLHIAIYDYIQDQVYISFHSKSYDPSPYQKAYDRPYIQFNLPSLFENYVRPTSK
jgi:isopenicillin-N N-acyltransferase-like protein